MKKNQPFKYCRNYKKPDPVNWIGLSAVVLVFLLVLASFIFAARRAIWNME